MLEGENDFILAELFFYFLHISWVYVAHQQFMLERCFSLPVMPEGGIVTMETCTVGKALKT